MRWKSWSKIGQSGNLRKKLFWYSGQRFSGAKPGKPKMHLRKSKKTVQDPQLSEDVILSIPSLSFPPKSETKKTDYTAHLTRLEESKGL